MLIQKLSNIPPLNLPHLKKLYLHHNNISKIEGLEGCAELKELYLFSNHIEDIDGLSNQGSLQQLWLQENSISSVSGVLSLNSLRSLHLAGNKVYFAITSNMQHPFEACEKEINLDTYQFS